ncbi:hypothetical protein GHO40_14315 [Pseudomonas helleri]|uniref:Phasin domain-containing protein n=1 Tax=Pseudomonas helleri TaxID=1608996 RepID=A0A6L5HVL1_9PSED|nr:hypothetical protein [Pseudomonas helleri]MQT59189.1 hypothetical protein [Pseudomonas sp. FSL R10-0399]MQT88745.1 hypothetical protein [Pseudomonas helleri]MQU06441.1 hypothetical protein [Pseudomonas helleri]
MENTLPLTLFKANLELQLQINRLLQENGHQWLEAATRASSKAIAESGANIEDLLKAGNWQALATLPSEGFWRKFQQQVGDAQTSAQTAISAQTAFTTGLQQAIQVWQKTTLETVGSGTAASSPFDDLFKQWGAVWASATDSANQAANRSANRG